MIGPKRLVLDANILVRAVFGVRVLALLEAYERKVAFYCPEICVEDARRYIPKIAMNRGVEVAAALAVVDQMEGLVEPVDRSLYEEYEEESRERIGSRDVADWPIIATALLLDAPIWTEDRDFFGAGIATWTSDRIELYLQSSGPKG